MSTRVKSPQSSSVLAPLPKPQSLEETALKYRRAELEQHPVVRRVLELDDMLILKFIQIEAAKRYEEVKFGEIREWLSVAKQSPIEAVRLLAIAVAHEFLGEKPENNHFAYILADAYVAVSGVSTDEPCDEIPVLFDIAGYILAHTHFDTLDGGHFYRRS